MSNNISIKISDFVGVFSAIAQKANINGGDSLEGEEINIFYNAQNSIRKVDKGKSIFSINDKTYDSDGNEYIQPPLKPLSNNSYRYSYDDNQSFIEYSESQKNKNERLIKNENALKAVKQYVNVKKTVLDQMSKHGIKLCNIQNPEEKQEFLYRAEYITKIICEKCGNYNISELSTVIAQIMGVESGGYNMTDSVLKNHGSQFKGMMQTNLEVCCSLFGMKTTSKVDIGNNRKLGSVHKTDTIYQDAYDKHFSQDEEKIQELKNKYRTPEALYKAIQEDVELSLEVGILAFKSKLSESRGDVKKAVGFYCGNQYSVNMRGVSRIYKVR